MIKQFTMKLVNDLKRLGRSPGECTRPDEPVERKFLFWFTLVPSEFLNTAKERPNTTEHSLKLVVAANQLAAANLDDENRANDLAKVVFWFGRWKLEKQLEKGSLQKDVTVMFDIKDCIKECPWNPREQVPSTENEPKVGAVFTLEVERKIRTFAEE